MLPVDEGMIHAWLDGALSADEAARIEQLVASDASWGAAAAEARGLIAASSRILSSLDAVPTKVAPASIATTSAARDQLRVVKAEPVRVRRVRPQLWAMAATLVMAVGAGVLWKNTPQEDSTLARTTPTAANDMATSQGTLPGAVASTSDKDAIAPSRAPSATAAAGSNAATYTAAGRAGGGAVRAESDAGRTAQPRDVAKLAAPEPPTITRNLPLAPSAVAEGFADAKKKNEDNASLDAVPLKERGDARRSVAAAPPSTPPAAAPAVAPAPSSAGALGGASTVASAQGVGSAAASEARALNAMKATAPMRQKPLADAEPARRSAERERVASACWTVRLSDWTPLPSFPVPVGVLLDSTHAGAMLVARALVGSNAPVPTPGQWSVRDDSTRVLIDRAVLGYDLHIVVSGASMRGQATLGDAGAPAKTSATAVMQPSRCPAP